MSNKSVILGSLALLLAMLLAETSGAGETTTVQPGTTAQSADAALPAPAASVVSPLPATNIVGDGLLTESVTTSAAASSVASRQRQRHKHRHRHTHHHTHRERTTMSTLTRATSH